MPRIPVHTLDNAPEQTRPTLQALQKKMGKLLNIHAEMAHSPVVLALVREAAGQVGAVEDTTWKQARAAGWTDEQLTEAFAHLLVNLFTNYFNHYVGTELDVPAAPPVSG